MDIVDNQNNINLYGLNLNDSNISNIGNAFEIVFYCRGSTSCWQFNYNYTINSNSDNDYGDIEIKSLQTLFSDNLYVLCNGLQSCGGHDLVGGKLILCGGYISCGNSPLTVTNFEYVFAIGCNAFGYLDSVSSGKNNDMKVYSLGHGGLTTTTQFICNSQSDCTIYCLNSGTCPNVDSETSNFQCANGT